MVALVGIKEVFVSTSQATQKSVFVFFIEKILFEIVMTTGNIALQSLKIEGFLNLEKRRKANKLCPLIGLSFRYKIGVAQSYDNLSKLPFTRCSISSLLKASGLNASPITFSYNSM